MSDTNPELDQAVEEGSRDQVRYEGPADTWFDDPNDAITAWKILAGQYAALQDAARKRARAIQDIIDVWIGPK